MNDNNSIRKYKIRILTYRSWKERQILKIAILMFMFLIMSALAIQTYNFIFENEKNLLWQLIESNTSENTSNVVSVLEAMIDKYSNYSLGLTAATVAILLFLFKLIKFDLDIYFPPTKLNYLNYLNQFEKDFPDKVEELKTNIIAE
jgi:hypothetical protein